MSKLILILVAAFAVCCYAEGFIGGEPVVEPEAQPPPTVRVDGKIYWAQRVLSNWTRTAQTCESGGMQLASITSKAQWSALSAAWNPFFLDGTYWTSGRDALEIRQFSWNETEHALSSDYLVYRRDLSQAFTTCVAFHVESDTSYLISLPCTANAQTICEKPCDDEAVTCW